MKCDGLVKNHKKKFKQRYGGLVVGLNSSDSTGCKVMEGGGRNYPQNVGHISLASFFSFIVQEEYVTSIYLIFISNL